MSDKTHLSGLNDKQVEASRAKYGANVLTPPEREPLWQQFLEKFEDPIIRILLVALLASVGIAIFEYADGHKGAEAFFEPAGIFVAIVLATGIGFWFEVKANKAFNVLNQVNDDEPVQVIRNGHPTEVPRRDVVVDDLVVLNTGDEVPADGDLLEAVSLQMNESTLTGEPIVKKSVRPEDFDKEATYPTNHVLRGTTVVDGHGLCRVTKVGDATENGKVFVAAQIDNSVKTPLNQQLDGLSGVITRVSYVLAALIIVGRLFTYFHGWSTDVSWFDFASYLLQTVMVAVTLIVVAVPEGLPMSVTLSLALSMRRMLKTNNLVRKMHACETMGATTVICTDKTGTLTQNQMRVHETCFFGRTDAALGNDEESQRIREGMAVNSTAFLDLTDAARPKAMGNPTEGALLLWLHDAGTDYNEIREKAHVVEQLTFSTERKYMATVVESALLPGRRMLYVKGAPEIVFGMCRTAEGGVTKEDVDARLLAYQNQAMRTLGFACQELPSDSGSVIRDGRVVADGLTFMGIVAIADPVRKEVPAAVKECLDAGIAIKIVTGDTPGTAREIGRQIGLWQPTDGDRQQITGPEFAALSDEELRSRVMDLKIISRARPMDKKRLVETLQELGQVVAVTGDGTNDAPALKAAQVGLSMGDGTSVAKEASDITIIDNSFSSITRAVMWGRSLYLNIRRFILFQMTINVAACLIVLIGAFMGTQSPLTVTQMLWVNLIMDTFAAMALASLPPSMDVMRDKPRRREDFIVSPPMWRGIIGMGVLFTALLIGLLVVMQQADVTSLTDYSWTATYGTVGVELTPYEESIFFSIFVLLQFWNMFNARAFATGHSVFHALRQCRGFGLIAVVILVGQVIIVTIGGQMFNVTPLPITDWLVIIGVTSLVLWGGELKRLFARPAKAHA